MRYSENVAKVVIERLSPGYEIRHADAEHESVPDFELFVGGSLRGVVEVTESVDRPWLEMFKAIQRRNGVPAAKCHRSWFVELGVTANLKNASGLDDALATLEASGFDQFPPIRCDDLRTLEPIYAVMQRLKVDVAFSIDPRDGKPKIAFKSPSRGGVVSHEAFECSIGAEANKEDNRRKLSLGRHPERHLFVLLTSKNILPCRLVVRSIPSKTTQPWDIGANPPTEAPSIPPEITHIWATAITDFGDEAVVWRVENGKAWEVLGKVEVPKDDSVRR